MDGDQQEDQFLFSGEEVEKKVYELVDGMLNGVTYDEIETPHWINKICEKTTEYLIKTEKPYKYIVNCSIMQKNGAGLVTSTACYWDTIADNTATIVWPKEKSKDNVNKTMHCTVHVFAVSL